MISWISSASESSVFLDTLELVYSVRPEVMTFVERGQLRVAAVIEWDDLPQLTRSVSSFQKQIDNAQTNMSAEGW